MSYFTGSKHVTELTPNDFDDTDTTRLKSQECTAVLFYAPWCPWCKKVKDSWEAFGAKVLFMNVTAFDCEKHKEHYQKIRSDLPNLVKGFPTMIIFKNGKPVEAVGASENERSLSNFVSEGMRVCQSK